MELIKSKYQTLNNYIKYHNHHALITAKFNGVLGKEEGIFLIYTEALTEEELDLIEEADNSYIDIEELEYIQTNVIKPAIKFGTLLIEEFSSENVLLGISQQNMTSIVRKNMQEVLLALLTGSLYDTIQECRNIPEDKKDAIFITDIRLLSLINKIENYLKLPLSTEV